MNRQNFFRNLLFAAVLSVSVLSGCGQKHSYTETEIASYADSSDLVLFSMEVELPVVYDETSSSIRTDLLDVVRNDFREMAYDDINSGEITISDSLATEIIVNGFGEAVFESLNRQAAEDEAMRIHDSDDDELEFHDFQWNCIYNLNRVLDEDSYCVYYSEMYEYLGGVHGGVTGSGYLTYSKADGHRVTGFLDEEKLGEMQELLIKGIAGYFAECGEDIPEENVLEYLFVEDGIIPYPEMEPYPAADGLCFLYNQYEIAPYVIGMPQFTIPYEKVRPFLSEEARDLLGL